MVPSSSQPASRKTDREILVRDVASMFNTYVAEGVRIDSFVEKAHPSLNIEGLDELLELYFVLTDDEISTENGESLSGVLSFIDQLPERMRRLKTTIGRPPVVTEDAIRGPIDWSETISARTRRPGQTERVFAYGEPTKQFDLPENRVLKRLLTVINDIVTRQIRDRTTRGDRYTWASPWTRSDRRRRILRDALSENPYLDRISECDEPLPYRDLDEVASARSPLYREAAALLLYFRRLKRADFYPEAARRLLRQFFLVPGPRSSSIGSDGTEVLFEFYWAYKLLQTVPSPRLDLVRESAQTGTVAKWDEDGARYTLYHDTATPGELRFEDSQRNTTPPASTGGVTDYFSQRRRLTRTLDEFYDGLTDPRDEASVSRRPDIVVIRRDDTTDEVTNVFVGEVKYSRHQTTIRDGVEQLLETVAHARLGSDYLASTGELLRDDRLTAGLFLDRSPFSFDEYPEDLAVFEYGDTPSIPF